MADTAERVIRVDTTQPSQPASLDALLELCALYMSPTDVDLVRAAYAVADTAHAGALRKSGENFIEHPIAVARILAELAMDADGIAAALLHDTVEDTTLTLQQVQSQFGPQIAAIVDGVTKFTLIETDDLSESNGQHTASTSPTNIGDARSHRERKAQQHSETVRKLFLAMSQDPRVVLLKLADRLHNMRTLGSMSAGQRETKARETLELFAPLAGRLGLYLFKAELEDLAFANLDPERYAHVSQRLLDEAMKRSGWAERVAERLRHELAARGIPVAVNWRIKHAYRAFREAEEHGMDIALLHDMIAFRVIVSSEQECYQALGAVHHLWHPHGDRIRDYVGTPKSNGYQSLHTAVFALDGRLAQLHIRTHLMHRAAQHGVALLWLERAALGGVSAGTSGEVVATTAPVQIEELMAWVRRLVGWHIELGTTAGEFAATVKGHLVEEQIVVYTPRGQARELPEGSTVLDLAYQIHTHIGDHAVGAFVQSGGGDTLPVGRDVPIDHVLQPGNVVRIKTSPEAWPTAEWREIAQTPYARERISRTLRALRRGTKADGSLTPRDEEPERDGELARQLQHPSGKVAQVELARCCYPCPGDAIAGLARSGRRVTVHRACCATYLASLKRRHGADGTTARALAVRWPNIQPITFRVHVMFEGQDHSGLMYDISKRATALGVNVSASSANSNRARYRAAIRLTLDLPPQMHVDTVLRSLRSVPGVLSVRRDTSKGCVAQPSEKP